VLPCSAGFASRLDAQIHAPLANLVTITPKTGAVARWTDWTSNLTVSGNVFTAAGTGTVPLIEVGSIESLRGTEIAKADLQLLCGEGAQFNGIRLPVAAMNGALEGAAVRIEMCFADDVTLGSLLLFEGQVAEAEPSSTAVGITVESGLALLRAARIPRNAIEPGCTNQLGDAICGINVAALTVTGTVAGTPTTTTFGSNRSEANKRFEHGVLTFTSGANNGEQRGVVAYAQSGGAFTLDVALPVAPAVGDTFTIHPGCNKVLGGADGDCTNKFANTARFRGYPFMPKSGATGLG
jgi:uncharacterized phage protein (TIGR02218 family)